SNNNRHLTVNNTGGNKLAELWQVNGKTYVDIGTGPIQLNATNGPGAQVGVLLNAPKLFLQSMSGNSNAYTISGTDTVNGISTTVEKANYTVNNPNINGFLPAGTHQVQSTIWVANQGQYLVKLQMTLTPANASGTPQAGQTPSTITMNATQIGTAPAVTAPATGL
ncbi:MAG TPA: hypothetical protein VKU87_08015, partial [Thermomicrobiaceae bacterium]|nr:hypothetical protein [Thermomicrobiaceae bacterium]